MSVPSDIPYTVLVVNDSNFKHVCVDPAEYVGRLRKTLETRIGDRLNLLTVEGKYGIKVVDPEFPAMDVEDRNKTAFVQSIENYSGSIDEVLIVSVMASDPYLDGVADSMSDKQITVTRYKYVRKDL